METLIITFWSCSFLVVYSYIIYPLFLYIYDHYGKRKTFQITDQLPKISIVIAAYNEEKVIQSRIENCLALDYPHDHIEVIIASDGSDDQTSKIVKQYDGNGIKFLDYKERRGKINVLNETVPQAKNDIVVFTDANTMFKRDAMKNLVRHFGDDKVGCVCGGLSFVNTDGRNTGELEGFYWRYETMLKKMEGRRGALLGANGAIYAIRKDLYQQCPEDTIIEDFVIPMKIMSKGYYVIYDPEASAIEETSQKIVQEKQRRIRIGAGDFQATFRLLPMLNPLKGFSALAFWSHKVLRWFSPFFLLAAFASNILLIGNPIFNITFIIQWVFYASAIVGQILSRTSVNIRFFSLCYYFVSMNVALLEGFFKYVTGTQHVAWNRTER